MPQRAYTVKDSRGFTLLEILMVIALVGILSAGGISLLRSSSDEARYDATVRALQNLRIALVGDSGVIVGGSRTNFGYLGDLGALPTTAQGLAALQTAPAGSSAWAVDAAARFGHGWNGPYVTAGINGKSPLQDAWGRNFLYANSGGTVTITSYGADGAAGGAGLNQDIVITIAPTDQSGRVYGFLSSGGGPYTGAAEVELLSANGAGALGATLVSVPNGSQGQFSFSGVPFGPRSVKVYQPSKAGATATLGPIAFTVDKPSVLVSSNLVDFNPGNAGSGSGGTGGTGGIPNGGNCTTNSNGILNAGIGTSQGSRITLMLMSLRTLGISAMKVDTASARTVQKLEFSAGNATYQCSGGNTMSPCPTADNQAFSLTPVEPLRPSIFTLRADFQGAVNNDSVVTIDFLYSDGTCDKVAVSYMF